MKWIRLLEKKKQQDKKYIRKMEQINKHNEIEFKRLIYNSLTELKYQIQREIDK